MPDSPFVGPCPATPLDGAVLELEYCPPCAEDPDLDACDGHCAVYFGSSASIGPGEFGAIHDEQPELRHFGLLVDGTFYVPGEDLTYDRSEEGVITEIVMFQGPVFPRFGLPLTMDAHPNER